jgi:hypothetical protein
MHYLAPNKGKPLGRMASSWDNFQTSSIENDDREAQGLSPKTNTDYFGSDDE